MVPPDQIYPRGTYVLTHSFAVLLGVYYSACILAGLILTIREATGSTSAGLMGSAIAGAIGASLLGSGLAYVRRLYKASVSGRLTFDDSEATRGFRFGFTMYFLFRPVFGAVIAVIFVVAFRAGIDVSTSAGSLTGGFLYTSMTSGFFAGFSAGAAINVFDERGQRLVADAAPGAPK